MLYRGACFCGAVAFQAEGDLTQGTMRCNCRFCRKMRYWEMHLPDPAGFRLVRGAEALAETPRAGGDAMDAHHMFCARCGTRLWTEGNIPELGGPFIAVCVNALEDIAEDALAAAPVHFANGAQDDWMNPAPVSAYL